MNRPSQTITRAARPALHHEVDGYVASASGAGDAPSYAAVSRIKDYIPDKHLAAITTADVRHIISSIKSRQIPGDQKTVAPATARSNLKYVRRFFEWLRVQNNWQPPDGSIQLFADEQKSLYTAEQKRARGNRYTDAELQRLYAARNGLGHFVPDIRLFLLLGLNLGFLPRHCAHLTPWHVDLFSAPPTLDPDFFQKPHVVEGRIELWDETAHELRLDLVHSLVVNDRLRSRLKRAFKISDPTQEEIDEESSIKSERNSCVIEASADDVIKRQLYRALVGALHPSADYHDSRREGQLKTALAKTSSTVRSSDQTPIIGLSGGINDIWRNNRESMGIEKSRRFKDVRLTAAARIRQLAPAGSRFDQAFLNFTSSGHNIHVTAQQIIEVNATSARLREQLIESRILTPPVNDWTPDPFLW